MRGSPLPFAGATRAMLAATILLVAAQSVLAEPPAPEPNIFPPWQHGANNDAVDRGVDFTVPQIDDLADFHGDLSDPKLVLYVGGNYFFAMAPLVQTFEASHPDFKGRIYWETIPPGLLVEQIKAASARAAPQAAPAGLMRPRHPPRPWLEAPAGGLAPRPFPSSCTTSSRRPPPARRFRACTSPRRNSPNRCRR